MIALSLLPAAAPALVAPRDILDATRAAIQRSDLPSALSAARQAVAGAPNDPLANQVLGVLLVAQGEMAAAEAAFDTAVRNGEKLPPTLTGLEELVAPGTALYAALSRQKAAITVGGGGIAARSNRGAVRLLRGNVAGAFEDIDYVAVAQSDWGVPWQNGALVWLEKNNPSKARESAQRALDLGENTARALTALAEAELTLGQLERANDDLKRALDKDPTYPYALLIRSRLLLQQARVRDSNRALIQALARTPLVATDSRFVPTRLEGTGNGGNFADTHISALSQHWRRLGVGRAQVQFDRQLVEGRSTASQTGMRGEVVIGSGSSSLLGTLQSEWGGRPGATIERVGITPDPGARFGFSTGALSGLHRFSLGGTEQLTLHVLGQRNQVVVHPSTKPTYQAVRDDIVRGEFQWEKSQGARRQWTAGAAWTQLRRSGKGSTPIQPTEQVLPSGTTTFRTVYAYQRQVLTPRISLMAGGLAGGANKTIYLQPIADLAFQLTENRVVHLTARPRMAESNADLFVWDTTSDGPQANAVDRKQDSVHGFNRQPTLAGLNGRFQNYELSLGQWLSKGMRLETPNVAEASCRAATEESRGIGVQLETVLFHRRMSDVYTQSADARTATILQLSQLRRAEATGIGERVHVNLTPTLGARISASLQNSHATINGPVFDGTQFPRPVPVTDRRVPNFPKVQGSFVMEWTPPTWTITSEVVHAGPRTILTKTAGVNGGEDTFYAVAKAATSAHVQIKRHLGQALTAQMGIYNLGRASFYPGYPGGVSGTFGFGYHF